MLPMYRFFHYFTYNLASACEKNDCGIPFGIYINGSAEGRAFRDPLEADG